ncbi:T9SS type A sorting domain-containing protein [Carboxylicivirga marina]|uniref:T9SS type A sorting domain-containing protein n=1 Tax=Carboxylicivirga marina TaxID=2800988 RepID=UPI002592C6CA|nr:T9SS type A sorting domain-containing protein [uncultured Carboxylicivirga sp.]
MKIMNLTYSLLTALTLFAFTYNAKGQITVDCDLNQSSHTISEYLVGTNSIYNFMGESFWDTTEIKSALMDMNCGLLRYPGGGPTSYYHWNDMNGQGWWDNWDPNYDHSKDMPAETFLDVDEYIALCNEIGTIPLIGINMSSGLHYNRVQDGIDEAKALVQYCVDNNYNVQRYYLDNEPYNDHSGFTMTWQQYAEQVKLYAPAIRAINPDIEIIINWRDNIRRTDVWTLLEEVGDLIDVYDAHWYWNWAEASFDNWATQLPMDPDPNSGSRQSYKQEIEFFNTKAASLGLNHLKLASLEWNIGPSVDIASVPTIYQTAVMQSEMLLQFMDGGLDMAALWAIYWPDNYNPAKARKANSRYLVHPIDDFKVSDNVEMFKLMSAASGKTKYKTTSNNNLLYPLAVSNPEKSETFVYFLYKGQTEMPIAVSAPTSDSYELHIFSADDVDMNNGSVKTAPLTYNETLNKYEFNMPAYSLARLQIGGIASDVPANESNNAFMEIYPNPVSDVLNLNCNSKQHPFSVQIISLQGEQVYFQEHSINDNQVDVSELNEGIYFITTIQHGKYSTKKFVKI